MLSGRLCPLCLSVTLVYCGQTVGWIKMSLGMEIGLGPGHIILGGTQLSPEKEQSRNFWPMSVVAKRLDSSRCYSVGRYRPRPRRHYVRLSDEDQAPPPKKRGGHSSSPLFGLCLLWPNGRPPQQLLGSCSSLLTRRSSLSGSKTW